MSSLDDLIKDQVAYASAGTYQAELLISSGLKVTVNTHLQKTRFVGSIDDHVYPEVVIWKQSLIPGELDKAFLAEFVETKNTIDQSQSKWAFVAKTPMILNIIIPNENPVIQKVLELVKNINANSKKIKIQTYEYDIKELQYKFKPFNNGI